MPAEAIANAPKPIIVDHGEVFTRAWVVDLILDLVGYSVDNRLTSKSLVEPACGTGAFLGPVIDRLLAGADRDGIAPEELSSCIRAFDIRYENVFASQALVRNRLAQAGVAETVANELAAIWVRHGDYLLDITAEAPVDFVVGNPPYIRLESLPAERAAAYRASHATMAGRADIYVGFIERGLRSLAPGGSLGFICADRWMRNAYGSRLRTMISENWSVGSIVKMQGVDAFEDEVDAYPAITVISRQTQSMGPVIVKTSESFGESSALALSRAFAEDEIADQPSLGFEARKLETWSSGPGGWPDCSPPRLDVLAHLDLNFPALGSEESGTSIGIGVATGADKIFLSSAALEIEPERLLPMALPRDISSGQLKWGGKFLVNPWDENGLVALEDWPKFHAYLEEFKPSLAKRHTAKRGAWHRTIDRVNVPLFKSEKLYIPDFKDRLFPVLDEGTTYPHHNLYWVTSDDWALRALGGFLLSDVANAFVEAYSVRMRGGYLRFQAQYLRRIRLPHWSSVSAADAKGLTQAFESRNHVWASSIANRLLEIESLPN